MVFQSKKKRGKIITERKNLKSEATCCRSALLLSFCENRLCLSQLIKKFNATEQGAPFRHFCVSKVITTAHAHESGVIFPFFQELSRKKIKALRPKMTKIASIGFYKTKNRRSDKNILSCFSPHLCGLSKGSLLKTKPKGLFLHRIPALSNGSFLTTFPLQYSLFSVLTSCACYKVTPKVP